ncbi:MAG: RNA methyltransferase TrmH family group 1 [Spirochaetes bacterium]|nr:MAG: RNA methyltransferase TrmH family group 1 [Spirochaetota bacterium]
MGRECRGKRCSKPMGQILSDIQVVLCRAQEPGNVGSACRAMKAMGFSRLVLADCPPYDEGKLSALAVHARDLYEKAVRAPTLSNALENSSLAAGFTRRGGQKRISSYLSLEEFAEFLLSSPSRTVSLVFGNERTGLSEEELRLCSLAVHIPTSPEYPSLNIAQAVQISCYVLARTLGADFERLDLGKDGSTAPTRKEMDLEIAEVVTRLGAAGFFKKSDSSHVALFLRNLLERAGADKDELAYLARLLKKASALAESPAPRRKI